MSGGEALLMNDERRCCKRELLQLPLQLRSEQTQGDWLSGLMLSLIHISEPTRPAPLSRMPSSA